VVTTRPEPEAEMITSWHDTREAAAAAVKTEVEHVGGTLVSHEITPTAGGRFMLVLEVAPVSWRGKTGSIEHVVDCPQESGAENYNIWTDDGHVAGSFGSPAEARRWAKREGVIVRAGVTRRSAGELAKGRRGAIGNF
jgi:hypothetical protein